MEGNPDCTLHSSLWDSYIGNILSVLSEDTYVKGESSQVWNSYHNCRIVSRELNTYKTLQGYDK